jgi:hypothetical protein
LLSPNALTSIFCISPLLLAAGIPFAIASGAAFEGFLNLLRRAAAAVMYGFRSGRAAQGFSEDLGRSTAGYET